MGWFGAAFGPLILFSLFSAKTTGRAALTGIIVGGLTVIFWPSFQQQILGGFIFGYPEPLYEIIPGFTLSALSIYLVSTFGPSATPAMKQQFKAAQTKYHSEK